MQLLDFQTSIPFNGLVELKQLPRLKETVESAQPLRASLQDGKDQDGYYIQSHIETECELICQFCMEVYTFPLQSTTRFRPVLTLEATREVSPDEEPIIYENGKVNLINMIEDDALLAIPNYPKCYACMGVNKG